MIKNKIIKISVRNYNGKISLGSVIKRETEFYIIENTATTKCLLEFCTDENLKENTKSNFEYSFKINQYDKKEYFKIIEEIEKNKDYIYDVNKYDTTKLNLEYLKYLEVEIDGKKYEIKPNDDIMLNLRKIMNFDLVNNAIYSSYNNIINTLKLY